MIDKDLSEIAADSLPKEVIEQFGCMIEDNLDYEMMMDIIHQRQEFFFRNRIFASTDNKKRKNSHLFKKIEIFDENLDDDEDNGLSGRDYTAVILAASDYTLKLEYHLLDGESALNDFKIFDGACFDQVCETAKLRFFEKTIKKMIERVTSGFAPLHYETMRQAFEAQIASFPALESQKNASEIAGAIDRSEMRAPAFRRTKI